MEEFFKMFERIDQTTGLNEKVDALADYFARAPLADKIWAVLLLRGRVKRTALTSRRLRQGFQRLSKAPAWLLDECYAHVGDTGETLALLLQAGLLKIEPRPVQRSMDEWMTKELVGLRKMPDLALDQRLLEIWTSSKPEHWFLINKLMTGAFRVGVSEKLVLRALARVSGDSQSTWHQWLMGKTEEDFVLLAMIFRGEVPHQGVLRAVPFCLAAPLEESFFERERPADYSAEWKWDGIRAQVIKQDDQVWIWSRGEDMVSESFPEITALALQWKEDAIVDGELLVWGDQQPRSFNDLQQRLGRKKISSAVLRKNPVTFMAYDLLHWGAEDLTARPLRQRREALERFCEAQRLPQLRLSTPLAFGSWEELKEIIRMFLWIFRQS